jgi:hypothetical protein
MGCVSIHLTKVFMARQCVRLGWFGYTQALDNTQLAACLPIKEPHQSGSALWKHKENLVKRL